MSAEIKASESDAAPRKVARYTFTVTNAEAIINITNALKQSQLAAKELMQVLAKVQAQRQPVSGLCSNCGRQIVLDQIKDGSHERND